MPRTLLFGLALRGLIHEPAKRSRCPVRLLFQPRPLLRKQGDFARGNPQFWTARPDAGRCRRGAGQHFLERSLEFEIHLTAGSILENSDKTAWRLIELGFQLREQNIERAGADECLVCEGGIGSEVRS